MFVYGKFRKKDLNKKKIILRLKRKMICTMCVKLLHLLYIRTFLNKKKKLFCASVKFFCLFKNRLICVGLGFRFSLRNEKCSKKDRFMCIYKVPYNPFYYHNILQSIKYYILKWNCTSCIFSTF